jgi:hypothetical protein
MSVVRYFGHGSGEQYIRSHKIRHLPKCATTMLWGCSSGLLRDQGDLDRTGTACHYMVAGWYVSSRVKLLGLDGHYQSLPRSEPVGRNRPGHRPLIRRSLQKAPPRRLARPRRVFGFSRTPPDLQYVDCRGSECESGCVQAEVPDRSGAGGVWDSGLSALV